MGSESFPERVREATSNVHWLHLSLICVWGGPGNPGFIPILRGLLGEIGIGERAQKRVSAVEATMPRGALPDTEALWHAWLSLWAELRNRNVPDDLVDRGMVLLVLASGVLYWCLLPHCGADFPLTLPTGQPDGCTYRWATRSDGSLYQVAQPTSSRTGALDRLERLLQLSGRPTTEAESVEKLSTRLREEMAALTADILATADRQV